MWFSLVRSMEATYLAYMPHATYSVRRRSTARDFGIVLVEAMASGKPIVAGANKGYRTVLNDEAVCAWRNRAMSQICRAS